MDTIRGNTETLLEASRNVGPKINGREDQVYDCVSSSELRTEPEYMYGQLMNHLKCGKVQILWDNINKSE
jgi:hypothetical protein